MPRMEVGIDRRARASTEEVPATPTLPSRGRLALAPIVFVLAMLTAHTASACGGSGGLFGKNFFLVLALMGVDMVVVPAWLLTLVLTCAYQAGWGRALAVLAGLNLVLAAVAIAIDEAGSMTWLLWLQGGLAVAVLVVGSRPRWRHVVFGHRPSSRAPR